MEKDFLVGENITIADHSLFATVTSIRASGMDIEKYTNITEWIERCEEQIPNYDEYFTEGLEKFSEIFNVSE